MRCDCPPLQLRLPCLDVINQSFTVSTYYGEAVGVGSQDGYVSIFKTLHDIRMRVPEGVFVASGNDCNGRGNSLEKVLRGGGTGSVMPHF